MSANNSYEAMMVFSVKNGEEGVPALIEKFKALIEQNGTLDSIDEWGKRKLAYVLSEIVLGARLYADGVVMQADAV